MSEDLEEVMAEVVGDLLDLLLSATLYVELKSKPSNPFVKKLGESEAENDSFQILKTITEKARYILPIATDYFSGNKGLNSDNPSEDDEDFIVEKQTKKESKEG
jgi:hypothetical protein